MKENTKNKRDCRILISNLDEQILSESKILETPLESINSIGIKQVAYSQAEVSVSIDKYHLDIDGDPNLLVHPFREYWFGRNIRRKF